jgi:hypothetical protein
MMIIMMIMMMMITTKSLTQVKTLMYAHAAD